MTVCIHPRSIEGRRRRRLVDDDITAAFIGQSMKINIVELSLVCLRFFIILNGVRPVPGIRVPV